MKRYITILLSFLLFGTCLQAQLLWKISGNGLSKPSYVLGAYTYAPMNSIDKIPGLLEACRAMEQVCGEVAITDSTQVEKINLELPEGTTFLSLFEEKDQQLLRTFFKKLYSFDVLTDPTYSKMSPLGVLASIEAIDFNLSAEKMFGHMHAGKTTFSDFMQKMTIDLGLPVRGLVSKATKQSYEVQRYDYDMPLKKQKKALLDYVLHFSKVYEAMVQDIQAYQTQELDSIKQHWYVSRTIRKNAKTTDNKEMQEWANNLPPIIASRSTLVVLPVRALVDRKGRRSLLTLLKKQGYTVEPVK